jgi:hypothetical protein
MSLAWFPSTVTFPQFRAETPTTVPGILAASRFFPRPMCKYDCETTCLNPISPSGFTKFFPRSITPRRVHELLSSFSAPFPSLLLFTADPDTFSLCSFDPLIVSRRLDTRFLGFTSNSIAAFRHRNTLFPFNPFFIASFAQNRSAALPCG